MAVGPADRPNPGLPPPASAAPSLYPVLSLVTALEMRLGRGFTIEGEVARGGMSRIYAARQADTQARIAIKVIVSRLEGAMSPRGHELEERFLLEMRILQKLSHPRIPPVLDAGEANGMIYFTMPFIEGGSLRERLKDRRPLCVRDALLVARDVTEALAYVHANGIIHRDVTPGNLLLSPDGVFLVDFGIAHAPSLGPIDSAIDRPRYVTGTPEYTSPERVNGNRAEDARSDLFSLGCVLFAMLSGQPPFPGGVRQALKERVAELPLDLRLLPSSVSDDVRSVLQRSLALYPAGRFATARSMRTAIDSALERLPAE